MELARNSIQTTAGPRDWFTGGALRRHEVPAPSPPITACRPPAFTSHRAPAPHGTPTQSARRSTSLKGSAAANATVVRSS